MFKLNASIVLCFLCSALFSQNTFPEVSSNADSLLLYIDGTVHFGKDELIDVCNDTITYRSSNAYFLFDPKNPRDILTTFVSQAKEVEVVDVDLNIIATAIDSINYYIDSIIWPQLKPLSSKKITSK